MSVKININKNINIEKLLIEYSHAGFYRASYIPNDYITIEDSNDITTITDIYNKHDPNPTPAEVAAALRKARAETTAGLSAQFKYMTGDQAVAWIENNVTSLATAKIALEYMARMVIALRDETMSELPDIP